jgi:hypothetical protein
VTPWPGKSPWESETFGMYLEGVWRLLVSRLGT